MSTIKNKYKEQIQNSRKQIRLFIDSILNDDNINNKQAAFCDIEEILEKFEEGYLRESAGENYKIILTNGVNEEFQFSVGTLCPILKQNKDLKIFIIPYFSENILDGEYKTQFDEPCLELNKNDKIEQIKADVKANKVDLDIKDIQVCQDLFKLFRKLYDYTYVETSSNSSLEDSPLIHQKAKESQPKPKPKPKKKDKRKLVTMDYITILYGLVLIFWFICWLFPSSIDIVIESAYFEAKNKVCVLIDFDFSQNMENLPIIVLGNLSGEVISQKRITKDINVYYFSISVKDKKLLHAYIEHDERKITSDKTFDFHDNFSIVEIQQATLTSEMKIEVDIEYYYLGKKPLKIELRTEKNELIVEEGLEGEGNISLSLLEKQIQNYLILIKDDTDKILDKKKVDIVITYGHIHQADFDAKGIKLFIVGDVFGKGSLGKINIGCWKNDKPLVIKQLLEYGSYNINLDMNLTLEKAVYTAKLVHGDVILDSKELILPKIHQQFLEKQKVVDQKLEETLQYLAPVCKELDDAFMAKSNVALLSEIDKWQNQYNQKIEENSKQIYAGLTSQPNKIGDLGSFIQLLLFIRKYSENIFFELHNFLAEIKQINDKITKAKKNRNQSTLKELQRQKKEMEIHKIIYYNKNINNILKVLIAIKKLNLIYQKILRQEKQKNLLPKLQEKLLSFLKEIDDAKEKD